MKELAWAFLCNLGTTLLAGVVVLVIIWVIYILAFWNWVVAVVFGVSVIAIIMTLIDLKE